MPESEGSSLTLAVDLGATNLRCALVDASGAMHARQSMPTPFDGTLGSVLEALASRVLGSAVVASAVVGVPGRVDYSNGRLAWGRGQPERWREILTEEALDRTLGLPVALANDADLATVGEASFGAGAGRRDVVYLTISSGVGAGVVIDGRLLRGRVKLGEVGLTLLSATAEGAGEPVVLEDLASGRGLEARARAAGIERSAPEVVDLVQAGDAVALRLWESYTSAVGATVVNMAHLFVPEVVVLGGGVSHAGALLLDPVRELLASRGPQGLATPIEVTTAALGDDAGLVGAAAWRRYTLP